ncbi:MAG: sugar phosphate nucleotidyltransferase [Candidatus Coatesbacteria bacterium]
MREVTAGSRATVILPAGGKGERLAGLAGARHRSKVAIRAGRMSLIERTVRLWARAGVKRFVVLVFTHPGSVRAILGDGRRLGVSVRYSADPGRPVGRGGAILLAVERGLVPPGDTVVVHNPDDQIVGLDRDFASSILRRHRAAARRGALATAVCVPWTEYAYSSFAIRRGFARTAGMYPKVRLPAHVGLTVFEPAAIPLFRKLISLEKKTDFEKVVFPYLARRRRLGITMIPTKAWIPVNDLRGYHKLLATLGGR